MSPEPVNQPRTDKVVDKSEQEDDEGIIPVREKEKVLDRIDGRVRHRATGDAKVKMSRLFGSRLILWVFPGNPPLHQFLVLGSFLHQFFRL